MKYLMIGYEVGQTQKYNLNLKRLSSKEEEFIAKVEQKYQEMARDHLQTKNEIEQDEIYSKLIDAVANENSLVLDNYQKKYLFEHIKTNISGFGFLEYFLKDDEIEEISATLLENARVYVRGFGWQKTNCRFTSAEKMIEIVNKMARLSGRVITMKNPRIDAILPSGSRLHASFAPISKGEITIRKFRENPVGPRDLVEAELCTARIMAILSLVIQSDTTLLVGGNTASGKTTTLNALFTFLPLDERLIIIEDTPEIMVPHEHKVNLISNPDLEIQMPELIKDTLRMRPDRLIIGEVRNPNEFSSLLEALLAGQARGTYATFHAQNSNEAKARLEKFGFSAEDLGSIDIIIIQRRRLKIDSKNKTKKEERKILEICSFEGGEKVEIINLKSEKVNYESIAIRKALGTFQMTSEEFEKEISKREEIINGAPLGFQEFSKHFGKKVFNFESD